MISDEPDEDADALDDDAAIESFLGDAPTKSDASAPAEMVDWPQPSVQELGLNLDDQTLAWFKSAHADWRREMRMVLRAWMITHTSAP